nr:glycosyltransferase [Bacteroidota bacterium]
AYNIEKFLPEAIESVLSQKTNFKVEMVIGEDCSTDNTRQIALDYQKKYPEIIRVLLPEKNLGITPNCIATHNACKGKYIALLDGDDYWTDETKLQKQVSFLENNPGFSGSAHQAKVIYDYSKHTHDFGQNTDAEYGVTDTISNRKFHTSALVYRKEIWDKVGGIPSSVLISNDRALYPMIAIFGKIKYLKDSMCVYRKTGFGISSNATYEQVKTELFMIPWLKKIDAGFPYIRFKSFIHLSIFENPGKINLFRLFIHYILFVFYSFSYFPGNLGDVKYGSIEFFKKLMK